MAGLRRRPGIPLRRRRQHADCVPRYRRRSSAEPIAEPVSESIAQSVTESIAQPVTESIAQPVTESIAQPATQSVTAADRERSDGGAGVFAELTTKRKSGPAHGATLLVSNRDGAGGS